MATLPGKEGSASGQARRILIGAWIFVLLLAFVLFARDALTTRFTPWPSIRGYAIWGRDFVNVYTSGKLVLQDRLDLLYDIKGYRAFQDMMFPGALRDHNYSYPPPTLLYTWVFALLPYLAALGLWLTATGAAFVAAARPYLREARLPAWVAIVSPAALANIWAGHYGLVMGALWLGAFHLLPRRPVVAGILVGLMLMKPHLAILAPLILIRRGDWTAFAAAAATVLALVGASILLFGLDPWTTYLTRTAIVQVNMVDDVGTFFITMMPTVMPATAMLEIPHAAGWAIQILVAAAAVGALLRFMPKDSRTAGLAGGVATFLVLPYAFNYDMTVPGLAALLVLHRLDKDAPLRLSLPAALAFSLPLSVMAFSYFRLEIGPPLLAFLLWMILDGERRAGRLLRDR
jgi:glycosyl transferase family 87